MTQEDNAINIAKLQVSVHNLEKKADSLETKVDKIELNTIKLNSEFQKFKTFAEAQAKAARLWGPIVFALLSFLGRIVWNMIVNQDLISLS